jgi:hypothetical protein
VVPKRIKGTVGTFVGNNFGLKLTIYSRLSLRSPPTFREKVAPIRRPGFLDGLEEEKYHQAFQNMCKCRSIVITRKVFDTIIQDVGQALAAVCEHIYFWVNPTYVKPASSEPDKLHRMDWMLFLSRQLWVPPPDSEGENDEEEANAEDSQTKPKDVREKTMDLVKALAQSIKEHIELWKEEVCTDQ